MTWLEALGYGFARGFFKAYFEEARKAETAVEEPVSEDDRRRAHNFAAAVERLCESADEDGDCHSG